MPKKAVPISFQQRLNQAVEVFGKQAESRAKIAKRAYDAQDGETREAINSMTERIISISRGVAVFTVKGRKVAVELPSETIENNALYLATEILKDLAMLDIRVANFRFDPKLCSNCGKVMAVKKKGVRS